MAEHKGLPIQTFADRAAWEKWLTSNGARSSGIWMKLAKKTNRKPTIAKTDAIEAALCVGWIDGQLDRFDDVFWLVRFTPRGRKSRWSQINRDTALRLVAAGKMKPAGQAEIDRAKADGRWDAAYAPQSRADVPDDLEKALDAKPTAKAFFATLKGANRYAILYRIRTAKTEKTRAARIEKFVAMLARGETIYPQKG
ncbi:YdeI/OmpD-associated family protein [Enhydrobacter sp.]|uniref:YdeI/OmpD-associated family protein n=1 Tax=Enhydrobacter sp. TaxID=1894999 RepID=UPI00260FEDF3|nr:YdeI/OmpD-associated family protein [Enhydrobacter sp.]WIM12814.1 MAG: putative periplasmic membrane protein [Enhydrobacter sp.]